MGRKKILASLEETIPEVQKKIVSVIEQEVDLLVKKEQLSNDDCKNLIAYSATLSNLYKDRRAEIVETKKDLKGKTKEEILSIIKQEGAA